MSYKLVFVLSFLALSSVALADSGQRAAQEPGPTAVSQSNASEESQKQKEQELDAARERWMERMMNRASRH